MFIPMEARLCVCLYNLNLCDVYIYTNRVLVCCVSAYTKGVYDVCMFKQFESRLCVHLHKDCNWLCVCLYNLSLGGVYICTNRVLAGCVCVYTKLV